MREVSQAAGSADTRLEALVNPLGPARGAALASEFFSDHLAQDVLIQRQLRHQAHLMQELSPSK